MKFNGLKAALVGLILTVSCLTTVAHAGLMYVSDFEFEDTVGDGTNGPITGKIFGTVNHNMHLTITSVHLTGVGEHPGLSEL